MDPYLQISHRTHNYLCTPSSSSSHCRIENCHTSQFCRRQLMQAPGLVTINDNLLMEKLFPISNQMIYPQTHLLVCSWLPTCSLSFQSLLPFSFTKNCLLKTRQTRVSIVLIRVGDAPFCCAAFIQQ